MALFSEATGGFVSVELPPHKYELLVHATSSSISAAAAFALMPGGEIVAVGPAALLNVCEPHDLRPPICVGYHSKPRLAHRKLLRDSSYLSGSQSAARFVLEPL